MARFDFRMDDELLERVRTIAKDVFNAPVHHRSGKPEITDALNKIIELGVIQIESGNYPDSRPAPIADEVKEELMGKIARLESEVERLSQAVQSGFNADNNPDSTNVDRIAALEDRLERSLILEDIPDDMDMDTLGHELTRHLAIAEKLQKNYSVIKNRFDTIRVRRINADDTAGDDSAPIAASAASAEAAPEYIQQKDLAKMFGLDRTTLNRWQSGGKPGKDKQAVYDRLFAEYRFDNNGWLKI